MSSNNSENIESAFLYYNTTQLLSQLLKGKRTEAASLNNFLELNASLIQSCEGVHLQATKMVARRFISERTILLTQVCLTTYTPTSSHQIY